MIKQLKILAGPLLGLLVYFLFPEVDASQYISEDFKGTLPQNLAESNIMAKAAGVATWIAVWWILEAVNIYYTALLPVFVFPFLGVMPVTEVAPLYMKEVIFLFVGGFLIAFGLERWNLHKRIALRIILLVGATPARILFGFMLASYLLSMWIMNTATVTLLLPAVLAVVQQIEAFQQSNKSKLATPFLLGLAYASSVGGIATLIGTAPNFVFMDFFNEKYPTLPDIDFANWFMFGLPTSIVLFVVCFLLLRFMYRKSFRSENISIDFCRVAYKKLGKMTYEEKVLSFFFVATVLLWFFRKDLAIGDATLPGWSNLLPEKGFIKESAIAMLVACTLFLFPSKQPGTNLITWNDVKRLPLGIIFLFGGGFALARSFEASGFSNWLASHMEVMGTWPPVLMVLILCLGMTFLTELTSNTASTLLVLPILFSLSQNIDVHPLQLFIPVVLSASCAFMLPVATPPNTIVFGSEKLKIKDMMRAGIWLNLIGVAIITMVAFTLIGWVFGV